MAEITPSEILNLTLRDAVSFLEEEGGPNSDDFVSAFLKIQDQIPEQCKKCPWLAHFATDVALSNTTVPASIDELRQEKSFYDVDSCPGADIDTIDGSNAIFNEIVIGYVCGRILEA